MNSSAPAVSVIIVNYNSGPRLRRCLDHLVAQHFRDFEILVVDNASSDDSIAKAREAHADIHLIEAGANLGFAAANNLAAKSAKGEWLAFLNPDAYAAPDWLEALLRGAEAYPDIDAFGSTQIDDKDRDRIDGAGDVYHAFGFAYRGGFGQPVSELPPEGECFAPCAAAAMIRKETFLRLGGFFEPFFCYSEDVDFGFRMRLAGARAMQLRKAVVYHEGSGVTGRHSEFTIYHGHRNRTWTWYLNMPLPLLIATAPFHFLLDLLLFAMTALRGEGRAYLRALRDGYGGLPGLSAERRKRQQERTASAADIARALVWSPVQLLHRSPHIRES
ncbi:glycosyltransferase family 2 protein [Hyphococcus sp.]|uniref:glycosyltransferase family 2 protein n=1 Tax=Hyphococcus sp. TaxID=2038636 RepID=UPI003D11736C